MAIAPPSDIVLDVSKAADPERLKVAAAKLGAAGQAVGTRFAEALNARPVAKPAHGRPAAPAMGSLESPQPFDVHRARLKLRDNTATSRIAQATGQAAGSAPADRRQQAMQQFEAVVLQTFIGSMLPQNAESVYGKGTAGDIWKSMMSEQLGRQMARAGGIGIADRLLAPAATAARSAGLR